MMNLHCADEGRFEPSHSQMEANAGRTFELEDPFEVNYVERALAPPAIIGVHVCGEFCEWLKDGAAGFGVTSATSA
jgi:hypothetical protein